MYKGLDVCALGTSVFEGANQTVSRPMGSELVGLTARQREPYSTSQAYSALSSGTKSTKIKN